MQILYKCECSELFILSSRAFFFYLSEQLILGCLQDYSLSHTRYLTATFQPEQLVWQMSLDLFYLVKDSSLKPLFNTLKVGTADALWNNNQEVGILLTGHLCLWLARFHLHMRAGWPSGPAWHGRGGHSSSFYSCLTPASEPRKSFKGNAPLSSLTLSKHS